MAEAQSAIILRNAKGVVVPSSAFAAACADFCTSDEPKVRRKQRHAWPCLIVLACAEELRQLAGKDFRSASEDEHATIVRGD